MRHFGLGAIVACGGCALVTGVGDLQTTADAGIDDRADGGSSVAPVPSGSGTPAGDAGSNATADGGKTTKDGSVGPSSDAGAGADAGSSGDAGSSTDASTGGSKLVFVTNNTHTGDFGGLAGADAFCDAEGGKGTGAFTAFLSSGTTSAISRLPSNASYRLSNGTLAMSSTALVMGSLQLQHGIDLDANTQNVKGNVWTGSDPDGSPAGLDCDGWTVGTIKEGGVYGSIDGAQYSWISDDADDCKLTAHVYCFEK